MEIRRKNTALINGNIITVDRNDTIAEAILISNDKIIDVGSNEKINSILPKDCEVIDLQGKSVMPGFIDSHTHLEMTVNHLENSISVHSPPFESLEQIFNKISEAAKTAAKGEWIIARGSFGMKQKIREGRLPTRQELDRITTDNPVVVYSGLHICVLNSVALNTMGWQSEQDLPRGSSLGRNLETGELTGALTEVWDILPSPSISYDRLVSTLKEGTLKHFVSRGVTSVHELPYTTEGIRAWQTLKSSGDLPLRLRLYLHHPLIINLDEFLKTGITKGFGDKWLSIGGVKLFADGTKYHANDHAWDDIKWTQEELDQIIYKVHKADLQMWTHVLTKTGTEMTITAYERALEKMKKDDHRHRMEHAGDSYNDQLYKRMAAHDLIPITTPQFIHAIKRKGKDMRLRSLIERGFILPGNTDSTGTQPESCNPWHSIWCAVERENVFGEIVRPEEKLTPLEAIRMFTYWAAWGGFEENIKGSLEPGKFADIVVTELNPLTCDTNLLRTMPVDMVLVGGEIKWSKAKEFIS